MGVVKMKILYDHQIFVAQKYGGISRLFYETIKRISQKEQVYLFAGINSNEYGVSNIKNLHSYFGFKKPQIRYTGRISALFNKLAYKLYVASNKTDIYHPTYYADYGKHNAKLVVTVYDMIHELFPAEFRNDTTSIQKANLLNKADRIIAISESTKKDIVNILGINPNKIDVVYLANSLCVAVNEPPIVKDPYILLVGHGGGYKNFPLFLEAYAQSRFQKDVKLVVFGGPLFTPLEHAKIDKLKLSKKIVYLSGNDKVLANLYKYAKLFIYPSQYEGFGLPPLEAMQYGIPCLVSNTSSIPEVVGDAGMYFDPLSIDSMQENMDKFLNSQELLQEYGKRGIEREKLFTWDKCAVGHLNTYRKVLEE